MQGSPPTGPLTRENWDPKGHPAAEALGTQVVSQWPSGHWRLEGIGPALLSRLIVRRPVPHPPEATGACVSGAKEWLISFDPTASALGIYPKKIIKGRGKLRHGRIHNEIIHDSKMCQNPNDPQWMIGFPTGLSPESIE